MPPLRRSARLRRAKTPVPEEEHIYIREKKRREFRHGRLPSANMDSPLNASGIWSDDSQLQLESTIQLLNMVSLERKPQIDKVVQSGAIPRLVEFLGREDYYPQLQNLPLKASGIWSGDSQLQLDATTQLLNLVSLDHNPLIDEVVQSRAVPRLVEFLGRDDYPQLQLEAARVLKNITSSTYKNTQVVTKCGAVPAFVKLLGSSELETCEQVVWSLGNIAGESSRHCKIVLGCGGLHPLLSLLEKHNNSLSFLRIGTWSLANILEKVRGSIVPFEQLEFAIRVLASLTHSNDEAVLKEACWALIHLSKSEVGIGTNMYEADLIPKLVSIIQHAPLSVVYPAIQAISSILRNTLKLDKRALLTTQQVLRSSRPEFSCSRIQKVLLSLACAMESLYTVIFYEMDKQEREERERTRELSLRSATS